jgi:PHD/YefM family antitoxin component YafN of YafNO toxin-antitoxin module
VISDHEQIIFTHKDGNVVLISQDEWRAWHETMRLFQDKRALKAVMDALKLQEEGKSLEEVFNDVENPDS